MIKAEIEYYNGLVELTGGQTFTFEIDGGRIYIHDASATPVGNAAGYVLGQKTAFKTLIKVLEVIEQHIKL